MDDFFTQNALYWLQEYRFDGLRLDAVHAICEPAWLERLGQRIRTDIGGQRHVHLVLEHDGNAAHLLHIRPWEWARLTVEETDHVLDWLDGYRQQIDDANAQLKN